MCVIVLGLAAFAMSCLGVAFLRRWAERHLLDVPNERSLHSRPMPRGGGAAIVVVTLGGIVAVWCQEPDWAPRVIGAFVAGGMLVAGVSFVDDFCVIGTHERLIVHTAGALLAVAAFGYWERLPLPFVEQFDLGPLGLAITIVWIVGLINAYNFMDGIDGIAGAQAVIAGIGWLLIGNLVNEPPIAALGALVAGSSLGFLWHNWPPARIFMGDVGSAFLGYTFGTLSVAAGGRDPVLGFAGLLLVWPFVFDSAFTFIRRWRNGENLLQAHRSHLYQRLIIAGLTHRGVTSLYLVLAGIGAGSAVAVALGSRIVWYGAIAALAFGLWLFVVWCERRDLAARTQRTKQSLKVNTSQ